jgi:cytidylate kinase
MTKDQVIALDGPSGSGKSTVAKTIADKLGIIYIDTGAMFRAVAYGLQHTGIEFGKDQLLDSEERIINDFFQTHHFKFAPAPHILITLDDLDLTQVIREHQVSKLASQVSKHMVIREFLKKWQRDIVKNRPAILDGRDIGTVIFPNAILKIFLTASPRERALRRFEELKKRGQSELDYQTILNDIMERDHEDMSRPIAPLKKAQDSVVIDSTGKSITGIVEEVIQLWIQRTKVQDETHTR